MKLIEKFSDIYNYTQRFAVTLGNFDGVHLGHQDFIGKMVNYCQEYNCVSLVITFVPHPHLILFPQEDFLINNYYQRRNQLTGLGVDYLLEIPFNRDLSTMSPKDFLDKYLMALNGAEVFFAGHDFAFGADKKGDFSLIQNYCHEKSIKLIVASAFKLKAQTVSSSLIRNYLRQGRIAEANQLLGRAFYLSGLVVKGMGRGRGLGYPTINLQYQNEDLLPATGVYLTKTKYAGQCFYSVTNVGFRPTFGVEKKRLVETYIFEFEQEIYGEEVEIAFLEWMRTEMAFSSAAELVAQMDLDIALAQKRIDGQ